MHTHFNTIIAFLISHLIIIYKNIFIISLLIYHQTLIISLIKLKFLHSSLFSCTHKSLCNLIIFSIPFEYFITFSMSIQTHIKTTCDETYFISHALWLHTKVRFHFVWKSLLLSVSWNAIKETFLSCLIDELFDMCVGWFFRVKVIKGEVSENIQRARVLNFYIEALGIGAGVQIKALKTNKVMNKVESLKFEGHDVWQLLNLIFNLFQFKINILTNKFSNAHPLISNLCLKLKLPDIDSSAHLTNRFDMPNIKIYYFPLSKIDDEFFWMCFWCSFKLWGFPNDFID